MNGALRCSSESPVSSGREAVGGRLPGSGSQALGPRQVWATRNVKLNPAQTLPARSSGRPCLWEEAEETTGQGHKPAPRELPGGAAGTGHHKAGS